MHRTIAAALFVLTFSLPSFAQTDAPAAAAPEAGKPPATKRDIGPSKKLGWRLGTQAYTFRDRSLFETIDTAKSLGLRYIEAYPGQKMSQEDSAKFDHNTTPEQRAAVKQKLKDTGLVVMNFGVVDIPADEAKARRLFDFAKDMGIQTICSEPKPEAMDTVEKMAKEFDIKVAIHNHPTPSAYWDPKTVAAAIKDRDAHVGCCADIGHWVRSGIKPVDAMKIVEGRILNFHFKDLNEFGKKEAHDVPWGTGVSDTRAVLEEAKRQNYKGTIMVEYEHGKGPELDENVRKCVEWFDKTVKELAE
jgi:sugar phosphate isomerase/epimerase